VHRSISGSTEDIHNEISISAYFGKMAIPGEPSRRSRDIQTGGHCDYSDGYAPIRLEVSDISRISHGWLTILIVFYYYLARS
jgi:hypothetical protein